MTGAKDLDQGLVGIWISCDPWGSEVEHRVSILQGNYKVELVDSIDGEAAEVFDVCWDGEHLRYSCHWPSTGRFVKNSLRRIEVDEVALTYTYTAQDTLKRKKID